MADVGLQTVEQVVVEGHSTGGRRFRDSSLFFFFFFRSQAGSKSRTVSDVVADDRNVTSTGYVMLEIERVKTAQGFYTGESKKLGGVVLLEFSITGYSVLLLLLFLIATPIRHYRTQLKEKQQSSDPRKALKSGSLLVGIGRMVLLKSAMDNPSP